MQYKIALIPGDGIGTEVIPQGVRALRLEPAADLLRSHFGEGDQRAVGSPPKSPCFLPRGTIEM